MSCISLKVLVVSMMLNLLIMPINSVLSVVFGYAALISSILLPIELMRYGGNCINKKQFKIILALVVIMCLNSFSSLAAIRASEWEGVLKALFSFFMFLLSISAKDIMYTEKDLKFFFSITRLFAIAMILYTIIPFDFQYVSINDYGGRQFTLSMGNPNATATKILFGIIVLCIENGVLKNRYLRKTNVFLIASLVYTILKLQSRTAFLCALIFIVYSMFLKFRIKKWMALWIWLVPVIFIPIQLVFIRLPGWELFDKTMTTGRENMFSDFLELISSSPLQFILGNFTENQLANSHNIIFTMIFNFGFVGLILFFVFWRIESQRLGEVTTKIVQYAWMGWIVFVIHSMAEAAVLSGAFTFGAILILLNRMTKDKIILHPQSESVYDWTIGDAYVKEGELDESIARN